MSENTSFTRGQAAQSGQAPQQQPAPEQQPPAQSPPQGQQPSQAQAPQQPGQAAPGVPKPSGPSVLQKPAFIWAAAAVVAILLFVGLKALLAALTSESTDDAFITGHIVSIAPRIAGQVAAVHVLDNEFVTNGELLVEIDPSDYASTLGQKEAAKASSDSNFKAAVAGYELMKVKVTTAQADAAKTKADEDAAAATNTRAQADLERAQKLIKEDTISQSEFDQFKAAADSAQADYESAKQKAASDDSKVNEADAQLEAAKAEADAVFSQVNESKTEVASAQLNVSYTKIFAPSDGLITRKQVETGNYLQVGQTIFSIVPSNVWVVGNFKESQLNDMKAGQKTLVAIDALDGRKFKAHVDSVQAGSGATFSLLPPENAVGNYVKVVQRVPVKIVFDEALPADKTIGPGLSVTPYVQTSSFSVPEFVLAIIAVILAIIAAVIFKKVMSE
jgi:membrane fusion protein, multidrug efflux system